MVKKFLQFGLQRKIAAGLLVLALIGGGYFGYTKFFSNDGEIRYVFAQTQRGTLIISISGSGQVSVSNQVDIKPKVSGDVVYVGVKNGQEVRAGTLIAQLDTRDAEKGVRDAEANLESANITLERFKNSTYENGNLKAEGDLKKAYENGSNTVANAFLDLPDVMTGLQDILFGTNFSSNQSNLYYYSDAVRSYDDKVNRYRDDAYDAYQAARTAYNKNFDDYKSASRFSDDAAIEQLMDDTYRTSRSVSEAVKSANNLIQFYQDKLTERNFKPNPLSDTHLSALNTYTGKTNTHLLNLIAAKDAISNAKTDILNAPLDAQTQELAVRQRENALLDAKEKLADYFVRAPFGGVIAKLDVKKGDPVSSATILATLITRQKIAEISLNEVDAAHVKIGQKATLTFDAIPDLTITGQVAEIDTIGTVSQGVVTYTIKIGFDTQDERVKTAMSVSAEIVTEAKPDVLLVPNSAIKQSSETSYVEMPSDADTTSATSASVRGVVLKEPLRRRTIEIGLVNDEFTEIVSGLNEGDRIVSRTMQSSPQQAQSSSPQGGFRIPGLPGGGGGSRSGGFR